MYPAIMQKEDVSERFFPLKFGEIQIDFNKRTLIMGILNITPDSFYENSRYTVVDKCISRIEQMIEQGADIIDIGAESTRPGSSGVSEEEELRRLMPVIEEAVNSFDTIFSVDTTKSAVAEKALERGVSIINDISGLKFDPEIADCVAKHKAGIVLMHTSARPLEMQNRTNYESLIEDIKDYLKDSIETATDAGIDPGSIIIDPGIGFGKTSEQNLKIINNLDKFLMLERPLLVGTSRKSFIGNILGGLPAEDRLEGTLASIAVSITKGASIVRVHDVKEVKMAAAVADAIYSS